MATVHYGDYDPFEIDGTNATLVAYYRGEGATVTGVPGEAPDVPARSANKPEWVAYAVALGADEAEAEALTKPELVEQYGGE